MDKPEKKTAPVPLKLTPSLARWLDEYVAVLKQKQPANRNWLVGKYIEEGLKRDYPKPRRGK